MPNSLGLYYLGPNTTPGDSMIDRVRRLLQMNAITVDTTTGNELSSIIQNQDTSNVDIINQINTNLRKLYSRVILTREDQFSQTFYLTPIAQPSGTTTNPPPTYQFPPGMLQLRYMDWLPPRSNPATAKPDDWIPMLPVGDPLDRPISTNWFGAPTWEYDLSGTGFVLNNCPPQVNQNGIRIRAVVMPPPLINATDVIQARFGLIMQECVIYDAAYAIAWSKNKQLTDEMAKERQDWYDSLIATSENAFHPPSTQMVTDRMVTNNYSGRRRRSGYGGYR